MAQVRDTYPRNRVTSLPSPCIPGLLYSLLNSGVNTTQQCNSGGLTFTQLGSTYETSAILDCHIAGDKSTDDTAALQSCIDSLPDYHVLTFSPGMKMKITGTINVHNKYGFRWTGITSMYGGPSVSTDAPSFFWYGADNGTMFDFDRTSNFVVEGLAFFTAPDFAVSTHGAGVVVNVDQTVTGSVTTTNGFFEKISIFDVVQNPNFIGIQFAAAGPNNVEHMTVRDSTIQCTYGGDYTTAAGWGIKIGGSFNAKKHLYVNNSISQCAVGIFEASGSGDIIHNQFNTNGIHIEAFPIDPLVIEDNDSENAYQFFFGHMNQGGKIAFNRIAAVAPVSGTGAIQLSSGSSGVMVVEGNSFDQGNYIPVNAGPGIGGALISRGNNYPNAALTLAGLHSFSYQTISELDFEQMDANLGFTPLLTTGTFSLLPPTTGFGALNYEYGTQKFIMTENGDSYKRVLPFVTRFDPGCTTSDTGNIWIDTTTTTSVYKICLSVSGSSVWVTK